MKSEGVEGIDRRVKGVELGENVEVMGRGSSREEGEGVIERGGVGSNREGRGRRNIVKGRGSESL